MSVIVKIWLLELAVKKKGEFSTQCFYVEI